MAVHRRGMVIYSKYRAGMAWRLLGDVQLYHGCEGDGDGFGDEQQGPGGVDGI